jgi:hypothetical protein
MSFFSCLGCKTASSNGTTVNSSEEIEGSGAEPHSLGSYLASSASLLIEAWFQDTLDEAKA